MNQALDQSQLSQPFLKAYQIACTIEDAELRDAALYSIVKALADKYDWKQAEAVIGAMGEPQRGWYAVAEMLAEAQRWQEAQAIAYRAERVNDFILYHLTTALIQAGIWEKAEEVARTINSPAMRIYGLSVLARDLAQVQQWEKAEALWTEVYTDLLSLEQSELELEVFDSNKASVLCRFLAICPLHWHREEVAVRVCAFARSLGDLEEEHEVLSTLASSLAQVGAWGLAEEVACSIKEPEATRDALCKVARQLIHAQQRGRFDRVWRTMYALASSLDDPSQRVLALCNLLEVLAEAGAWQQAEAIRAEAFATVNAINYTLQRMKALSKLAVTLVWIGQWRQAEEIARSVDPSQGQAHILRSVAIAFADEQEWQRAKVVAYSIGDSKERDAALYEIISCGIEKDELELTEELAYAIRAPEDQIRVLCELTRVFASPFASEQQRQRARSLWTRAQAMTDTLEKTESWQRSQLSETLVSVLIGEQKWAEAEAQARLMNSDERRRNCYYIVHALCIAQEWQRAEELARSIDDPRWHGHALLEVVWGLAPGKYSRW